MEIGKHTNELVICPICEEEGSEKLLLPNSKMVQHLRKLEPETDPQKIAEIINKYFTSIGLTLASIFNGDMPTLSVHESKRVLEK